MGGPCAGATQVFEDFCIGLHEVGVEDARKLELRTGWIEQRADDVENAGTVALGEKLSDWHNGAKCGMAGWCEKEAATGHFQGRGHGIQVQVDFHAKGFKHIGAAGF
jgi:hypothetical protein